jgi:hypothetical protein
MMVREIFSATGDLNLASRALPILLQEYEFWTSGDMSNSSVETVRSFGLGFI